MRPATTCSSSTAAIWSLTTFPLSSIYIASARISNSIDVSSRSSNRRRRLTVEP